MHDLGRARAPLARCGVGLYESHYLTAADPAGGRALWLRHTVLKPPGGAGRATTWVTWFDRTALRPQCHRVTAAGPVQAGGDVWTRSDHGRLWAEGAAGAVDGFSWELAIEPLAAELPYLPARWLYDRPVPRSNGVALVPAAIVSGHFEPAGGAPVALERWDGIVGHNWGSEHPEQWSWLHAGGLGEDRLGWLDLVLVRIRVGPVLTPWMASGAVRLDGVTRTPRLGGRASRVLDGEHAAVVVPLAGGGSLRLAVSSPAVRTATWDYASPRGPGRVVRNCSIADAAIRIEGGGVERELLVEGRVAAEHGAPAG